MKMKNNNQFLDLIAALLIIILDLAVIALWVWLSIWLYQYIGYWNIILAFLPAEFVIATRLFFTFKEQLQDKQNGKDL